MAVTTGTYTSLMQRPNNPANTVPLTFGVPVNANIENGADLDTYTFTELPEIRYWSRCMLPDIPQNSGSMLPTVRSSSRLLKAFLGYQPDPAGNRHLRPRCK